MADQTKPENEVKDNAQTTPETTSDAKDKESASQNSEEGTQSDAQSDKTDGKKDAKKEKADKASKADKKDKKDGKADATSASGSKNGVTYRTVAVSDNGGDEPLLLDKQKWLFWVLVAIAVIGIVLCVVVFVVKGDSSTGSSVDGQSLSTKFEEAGYTTTYIDENSAEMVAIQQAVQTGFDETITVKWCVTVLDGETVGLQVIYIDASDSGLSNYYTMLSQTSLLGNQVERNGNVFYLGTSELLALAQKK